MTSSAKKKKEKKKDFQKTKLKVGKTRPKNSNATDTSFSAKSIVFKQQNLSETGRDSTALFHHTLSLLGSKSDTQRRDALAHLTTLCSTQEAILHWAPAILAKSQPLVLDGNTQVRQQLLKLLQCLPARDLRPIDQLLLYTRAGMAHLSADIRMSSLDVLDWIIATNGAAVVSCPGGWVKTLRTFQNLLSWHGSTTAGGSGGKWSSVKTSSSLGNGKLLIQQLTTLSLFLTAGLAMLSQQQEYETVALTAAEIFPLWHTDSHMPPRKSNPFGYLNLFGVPRDVEGEIYETAEQRAEILVELGLREAFHLGTQESKKEGGELGRAAALVEQALAMVAVD